MSFPHLQLVAFGYLEFSTTPFNICLCSKLQMDDDYFSCGSIISTHTSCTFGLVFML